MMFCRSAASRVWFTLLSRRSFARKFNDKSLMFLKMFNIILFIICISYYIDNIEYTYIYLVCLLLSYII